jgi:hypothetical protein
LTLRAISLRDATVGGSTWLVLALLAVVTALVLLVACANIATVMLSRARGAARLPYAWRSARRAGAWCGSSWPMGG